MAYENLIYAQVRAMSDLEPKDSQQQLLKPAWLNRYRLLSAVLLHGLWKLRWYQTVFILWPMLLVAAWGASPYFMVYVVGMPAPGTAPRYTGTIRVEGDFQFTKNGTKPPKYFIKTNSGETEFHCGYLSYRQICWLAVVYRIKPEPNEIYEIGYNPYWGLDYIKYPERIAKLDDYGSANAITRNRYAALKNHLKDLMSLCFFSLGYLLLIWLAYKKSAPNCNPELPYLAATSYQLEPVAEDLDEQRPRKSTQSKHRRSFFD